MLCAFDLIELDGEDLRRTPIEHRKRKLAKLVRTPHPGIVVIGSNQGLHQIAAARRRQSHAPKKRELQPCRLR
jgi:ATP-dependent DNA ligase